MSALQVKHQTKFIINHIKKIIEQGNDIAKEMQTMTAVDQSR